jgi:hypothetical protein
MEINPEECVSLAQFKELKQSLEEKLERSSQDIQALMNIVRGHQRAFDGESNQYEEIDKTDAEASARRARKQQEHDAFHGHRPPRPEHGNNVVHGRGRGHGRVNNDHEAGE